MKSKLFQLSIKFEAELGNLENSILETVAILGGNVDCNFTKQFTVLIFQILKSH